jgi:hypothetical protein
MKTTKLNFTIPEDVAEALRTQVSSRKRSAFVSEAVRVRLNQIESEKLRKLLAEGYSVRNEEDKEINREWEQITLEKWG